MRWISGFFNPKKSEPCQQQVNSPVDQNSNATQNPNTMLQVVVEETVMAVAKWLVTLINRSLEAKVVAPVAPVAETSTTVGDVAQSNPDTGYTAASNSSSDSDVYQTDTVEELLAKFSCLIQQSHDRIQSTTTLENRIRAIESFLKRDYSLEQQVKELSQSIVNLENRLAQVETLVERVDAISTEDFFKIEQHLEQKIKAETQPISTFERRLSLIESSIESESLTLNQTIKVEQDVVALEKRIVSLEKLFTRMSLIVRYVENNYRSIASLQKHVKNLDSTSISDKNGSHN
jgi:ATP-dependent Lon protease